MTEISKYLTNPQIHQIHQLQKPVVWILRSKRTKGISLHDRKFTIQQLAITNLQFGNLATWQFDNLATWQFSKLDNLATWQFGKTWQFGNLAIWQLGNFQFWQFQLNSSKILAYNLFLQLMYLDIRCFIHFQKIWLFEDSVRCNWIFRCFIHFQNIYFQLYFVNLVTFSSGNFQFWQLSISYYPNFNKNSSYKLQNSYQGNIAKFHTLVKDPPFSACMDLAIKNS